MATYHDKRDGKENIEDYGYGKGYQIALAEFRKLIPLFDLAANNGITVIITAHSHIKAFANPAGDNYDRYELKSSKQIGSLIKEWSDTTLFAEFETHIQKARGDMKAKAVGTQNRIVHTIKTAAWDAKNRYGLPDRMPLDMPTNLAEIDKCVSNNDNGGECAKLMKEIDNLVDLLADDERAAAIEYVKKNISNKVNLTTLLNRIRVKTQNQKESEAA